MFNKQLLFLNKYKDSDLNFEYIVTAGTNYDNSPIQGYLEGAGLISLGSINKNTFKEYTINGVFNKSMGYGRLLMYFSLNDKLTSPFTYIKIHAKEYNASGEQIQEFDTFTITIDDNLYYFDKSVVFTKNYKLRFNFIEIR